MTTSRSRTGPVLGLALLAAVPAFAQEIRLPSGHAARLFDVVLEAGVLGTRAPLVGSAAEDEASDPADWGTGPLDEAEGETVPPTGGVARFRLVVTDLGQPGAEWGDVAGDFLWLCESVALPALAANGWQATEVVVALSDREVPFGTMDPEAIQFFEGFQIEGGVCVPQAF
ncbi:DUF6497 family protein [Rubellimicrobium sp. CFH 75288]|uniref:DUF6497 family protein n=1 Tax=Rubellimicrobium sp. CFH 75288 TaxID=2697034 RepID=UPI0014129EBB|nr:DUF6497 family protein [Rubellimicrobium sp. CFH 75288]NAZ35899.1 hypothetical protein [Rubellimicrobium sp. CFH 75288]